LKFRTHRPPLRNEERGLVRGITNFIYRKGHREQIPVVAGLVFRDNQHTRWDYRKVLLEVSWIVERAWGSTKHS
jgi:hypothetical protein